MKSPFRITSYNDRDGSRVYGIIKEGNTAILARYNSYEQAETSLDALNKSYQEGLIQK